MIENNPPAPPPENTKSAERKLQLERIIKDIESQPGVKRVIRVGQDGVTPTQVFSIDSLRKQFESKGWSIPANVPIQEGATVFTIYSIRAEQYLSVSPRYAISKWQSRASNERQIIIQDAVCVEQERSREPYNVYVNTNSNPDQIVREWIKLIKKFN